MHGKCPEKQQDSGKAERLQDGLGEGRRRLSHSLRCSLRFYDFLHFSLTPTSPLAAPATAGLGNTCGARGARGQGARSGPRCPFKGSRNFPLWYQMSLVTSVGRGSGARSEEIGDSSFPGKRRRPRRARVNGATLRGPGRTPRLALTLAGAGRGPALVGQPPPARGGSGDQLAELGAGWGGSGASSSRSGRASFSVLLLRSAAAGPAARPALPRSPARRRVAEPLSPDGTGPAQRAPRAPPRAWARWPGRCCCRCWLSGSYERPRRWPPRPSRCLSGWPRPRAEGLCLPRGPDPLLSPARTAWRSPWSPLGVRPTSWPWWITCRGTPAAATTWRCRSGPPRRR